MSLNRSLLLHSSRLSPFQNKRNRQLLQREDTLNLSPIFNETSVFRNLNDTSLRQALDDSSILVSNECAGNGLSEVFFEIILTSHQSNILETLDRLAQACLDSLELIDPWNRYNVQNCWLLEEANTWKLLQCLYGDSIKDNHPAIESSPEILSQQMLVDSFFQTDVEARLLHLLVKWLEASAAYQEECTQTSAPVISNNVHWGNTLHQLLIGTSLFNKERGKAMVTCIDPDAPRRQKRVIHSDDQQQDNDLCKKIFVEVRCGKFNEAISLCLSAGQAWRAAVLQGWRLLHYLPRDEANAPLQISGNPSRDLWKWCCLGIANNSSENMYYRATLGVLCGHLQSTLPACQGNWKDLLWAHLRVQLEARVDKFLREHHSTAQAYTTSTEVLEMLELELCTEEISLEQIFNAVNSLMDGKKESQYQKCQKNLMLGYVRVILEESLDWIENAEEKLVRFIAHLVLILRQMGKDPVHDIGNRILEKYVSQLIERLSGGSAESAKLIAYYTSTVPTDSQIELYSTLLHNVTNSDRRPSVVQAGLSAGLDVSAAARVAIKKAINAIHQGYGNIDMTYTKTVAAEKDKSLVSDVISSLEWLALLPGEVEDALSLSNAMIRTFIFIDNTEAASLVVVKLNELFPSFMNKVSPNTSALQESLCLQSYLQALKVFATWYMHFGSGQPKDVEPLPADATFSDKVYHEQQCAQLEQHRARWVNANASLMRESKDALYKVLLFPGGWLNDVNDESVSSNFSEEEKLERKKQLETLRLLCIPEVVILILKILQSSDDIDSHKEAIKLSDMLAGENRCLYKLFTKEKLSEVLGRIKESSSLLLEKGRDMFGYEIMDD